MEADLDEGQPEIVTRQPAERDLAADRKLEKEKPGQVGPGHGPERSFFRLFFHLGGGEEQAARDRQDRPRLQEEERDREEGLRQRVGRGWPVSGGQGINHQDPGPKPYIDDRKKL